MARILYGNSFTNVVRPASGDTVVTGAGRDTVRVDLDWLMDGRGNALAGASYEGAE